MNDENPETTPEPTWLRGTVGPSGTCVEVAYDGPHILVRYSEDPKVRLFFTRREWECFVKGVKLGEFDRHDPLGSD